ncbi:MAG: radical SAM protein [Candidatus Tenebribacter davisii]|jgi:histone acetyltransferase (RNA polymerase elongator complex component)|nr:radical SAM protein [Candidatus Tenebribacter davisii]
MKIFPIFIPHLGCPFNCVYCDQVAITKSKPPEINSISESIRAFCEYNKNDEKEIAFFGGTFTKLKKELQQTYFDAVNVHKNAFDGIRISTRPDSIDQNIIDFCKDNNVRTIELGIQSFDTSVLNATKRGYTSQTAINSCNLIKENNIRLGIQLMPGLPGFNTSSLKTTIETTIALEPEFVRIYPTIVLKNTKLEGWYQAGNYSPLSLIESIKISAEMIMKFREKDIIIIKVGLHSDIDKENIIAGPYHQSFGELVRAEMLRNKILNSFEDKTLEISRYDISLFKGFNSKMLKDLKLDNKIDSLPVKINNKLLKDQFKFSKAKPDGYW